MLACYTTKMQRRNIIALTIFAVFYISFGAYLTLFQERVIYIPNSQDFFACPALADATAVIASGTRLYAKLDGDRPTAVLYHGNAGSACDRAMYAELFLQAGLGYVLVEYAGYSDDPLPPTHDRIKDDVRNVIAYLDEQGVKEAVVVGESLGTGVASYHASLAPPSALILITPFTDMQTLASSRFWFYPTSFLVNNAFDNVAALENYEGKVLIIHGERDTIIPYRHGQTLYESLGVNATFVIVANANHNDLFLYDETFLTLQDFLLSER